MKFTILALTAFIVATAPLAWAQEDATTPAPEPEATAPENPESPATDPSVSVTTDKSPPPAAEKSSSPAATKSSSPAATKSSSPAATKSSSPAAKSSAPAAVMPTKKSTPEATLRDIEDKWEASIMLHDPSVAQAYLGNDYRGVSSKGKIMSKSSLLAEIKKDTDTYTSAKNGKLDIRVYGAFAVVMGTSTEVGTSKDGKPFNRSYRWTDAWVERNGKWQCVASQAMLLPN